MDLFPLQVGVQVPNAAERVARHASLWARTRTDDGIMLQVDMRNAFNSIYRQEMLKEGKSRTPLLYPYAAARYQSPSVLIGDGFEVNSSQGVQQGDVCGHLLFSVILHRLLLRLEQLGLSFQHWYLDDGILCGKIEVVVNAVQLLCSGTSCRGLGWSSAWTNVWWLGSVLEVSIILG